MLNNISIDDRNCGQDYLHKKFNKIKEEKKRKNGFERYSRQNIAMVFGIPIF